MNKPPTTHRGKKTGISRPQPNMRHGRTSRGKLPIFGCSSNMPTHRTCPIATIKIQYVLIVVPVSKSLFLFFHVKIIIVIA